MFSGRRTEGQQDDGVAWWLRFSARAVGCLGGIGAIIFGVWACVTLTPRCLVAGILQIVCGFVLVIFEAPCCCTFLDFVNTVTEFADSRPYWQKALIYALISWPPMAMCPEVSTILGAVCIFITATLYGMMAMGKKGDRSAMMAAASSASKSSAMSSQLVDNMEKAPPPTSGQQTV